MDNQTYSEPMGETWKYDPEYHRVSEFLGVNIYDRNDSHAAEKISFIKDWAKQQGGKDINDSLLKINGLRKQLGHQFIGKPLINELYQYIRLSQGKKQEAQTKITKPRPQANSIQKAVAQTVQQSITEMVKQALGDKRLIQNTVQQAIKEGMK